MSGQLPDTVKPFSLAETGQTLSGNIALAKMRRLAGSLKSDQGTVKVELEFGCDEQGIHYLKGHLTTALELVCQRCMQGMSFPVDINVNLAMMHSMAEAERLPSHYEPLVIDGPTLSLQAVIEDELILVLPIVALHDRSECQAEIMPAAETEAEKDSPGPFAVLARLKGRIKSQS